MERFKIINNKETNISKVSIIDANNGGNTVLAHIPDYISPEFAKILIELLNSTNKYKFPDKFYT